MAIQKDKKNQSNNLSNRVNNVKNSGGGFLSRAKALTKKANSANATKAFKSFKSEPTKYNYETKERSKWTAPEYAAYGSITGNNSVNEELAQTQYDHASQFRNEYRGGRPVLPQGMRQVFRDQYGYEGPFDQQFIDDFRPVLGSTLNGMLNEKYSVKKPGKKSSAEEWAAWYYDQVDMSLTNNVQTNEDWNDVRKKLNNFYDDFTQINGREPTYDEFIGSVDISGYSTLKAIDDSVGAYTHTTKILPLGTYYSPEVLPGLYYAKTHGDDITVDRDYFLDAKAYAMSKVQSSPSVRKYSWSDEDMSAMTAEDHDNYINQLYAAGNYEEASAFQHAYWASRPDKPEYITTEPSILDGAVGYYHDEDWFKKAHELLPEYDKLKAEDGSVPKAGKRDSKDYKGYKAEAARELYEAEQLRDKTNDVETAYNEIKDAINNAGQLRGQYTDDEYEEFHRHVMASLDTKPLEDYFKNGSNGEKYCRYMPYISEANIDAMIRVKFDDPDADISRNIDYSIDTNEDNPAAFGADKPQQEPINYNESQRQQAAQSSSDRTNAERDITQATADLSNSGVASSKGDIPVVTTSATAVVPTESSTKSVLDDPYVRQAAIKKATENYTDTHVVTTPAQAVVPTGSGDKSVLDTSVGRWAATNKVNRNNNIGISGVLARLWSDFKNSDYIEKLGKDYTPQQAAATDPVLNQLDVDNMPDQISGGEVVDFAEDRAVAAARHDDITLMDGIIGNAIPGYEHLANLFMSDAYSFDQARAILSKPFDDRAYTSIYNDRIINGYSEEEAAELAFFGATVIPEAIRSLGDKYSIDETVDAASQRLIADISKEEGSKDTYEMIMDINNDVFKDNPDVDLSEFNAAFLVGASDSADPGHRALTNDLIHSIATGEVTPDDIVSGIGAWKGLSDVQIATNKLMRGEINTNTAQQDEALRRPFETFTMDNGKTLTYDEYKTVVLDEAKSIIDNQSFLYSVSVNPDNLSEELKAAIDYPAIEELSKQYYGDDLSARDLMVEDAIRYLVHPDKQYNTSPMLMGSTDFIGGLDALAENKTWEINENAGDTRGWWQRLVEDDRYDLLPAISAFFGGSESEIGELNDLFKGYGKWFSRSEINAAFKALYSGKATYAEIENLVNERIAAVPEGVVSAINNPNALEQSYTGLDNGLSRIVGEYTDAPDSVRVAKAIADGEDIDKLTYQYLGVMSNLGPLPSSLNNENYRQEVYDKVVAFNKANNFYDYDEKQINELNKLVSFLKECGPSGIILASLNNDAVKKLSGGAVDLDAAGFSDTSAGELLSRIDPNWVVPYGINPGVDDPAAILFGGVSGGLRSLLELPSSAMYFTSQGINKALYGEGEYDSAWASAYKAFKDINKDVAVADTHVATKGEAFVRQGISEFTRNLLTSAVGGKLSDLYTDAAMNILSRIPISNVGMPLSDTALRNFAIQESIAGMSAYMDAVEAGAKTIGRIPFASSVFFREANDELEKGSSFAKSAIKGTLSAGIELMTEDLPLEKLTNVRIGNMTLEEHALNNLDNFGGIAAYYVTNTARSMVSEIGEEEASEILGRFVDLGEGIVGGGEFFNELRTSFEGLPEAMRDTAISTAFTTMLFGLQDLGGMTYSLVSNGMRSGQQIDTDQLVRAMMIDLVDNMEAAEESEATEATSATQETEATEVTEETAPVENDALARVRAKYGKNKTIETSPESQEGPSEATEAQTTTSTSEAAQEPTEASEAPVEAPAKEYNPKTDVPVFEKPEAPKEETPADGKKKSTGKGSRKSKSKAAKAKVEKSAKNLAKNPSKENQEALKQSAAELSAAIDEEKAEAAQEAEQAQIEQEQPQTQQEPQSDPNLTEGANKVKNYLEQSEGSIDKAVAQKAGENAADEAVNNDPGLKSAQKSLDDKKQKAQNIQAKVQQLASEGQKMVGQMQQLFKAAADEGIDPTVNSAQIVNAKWQLQEAQGQNAAETAKEQEKLNEIQQQVESDTQAFEENKEQISTEAREKAVKDAEKRINDARQKRVEEATEKGSRQGPPRKETKLLMEMNKEDQRILNAQKDAAEGLQTNALYTDDEYKENAQRMRAESDTKLDLYSQGYQGMESTENLTDPGFYKAKPYNQPVNDDQWKDERKQNEEEIIKQEERNARMLGDFQKYARNQSVTRMVPVNRGIYDIIEAAVEREYGNVDRRFAYSTDITGETAQAVGPTKTYKGNVVTYSPNQTTADDVAPKESEVEYYTADKFLDEDGGVSALAYKLITAVDPDFSQKTLLPKLNNGATDNRLEHVSENRKFIILRQKNADDSQTRNDSERLRGLTKKSPVDGKSGLDRFRDSVKELSAKIDSFTKNLNKATQKLLDATTAFDNAQDEKTQKEAASLLKEAQTQVKAAQRSVDYYTEQLGITKQRLFEAEEFVVNYNERERGDDVVYIIDKSKLTEQPDPSKTYDIAVQSATARMPSADQMIEKGYKELILDKFREQNDFNIEDYTEALTNIMMDKFNGMSDDDLCGVYFNILVNEELNRLGADAYRGVCTVVKGSYADVNDQVKKFISENGGTAIGDPNAFAVFKGKGFYNKNKAFFVSEDAIFKYLDPEMIPETGVKESKNMYNNRIKQAARAFTDKYNLSEEDFNTILDSYRTKAVSDRQIGTATVVKGDKTHLLGIPTKMADDWHTNSFIRDEDGSFSIVKAKSWLEKKIKWMVGMAEKEQNGVAGAKELNTKWNTIQCYWTDDSGVLRNRKIGEYYEGPDGTTQRWFPPISDILNNMSKVVCNFYCLQGKNNQNSKVNFTLFFDDVSDAISQYSEARDAMENVDVEASSSEIAHRRGRAELLEEFERLKELYDGLPDDNNGYKKSIGIALANAEYNFRKRELRDALEAHRRASPDKKKYWEDQVEKCQETLNEVQAILENRESKAYGRIVPKPTQREAQKAQSDINKTNQSKNELKKAEDNRRDTRTPANILDEWVKKYYPDTGASKPRIVPTARGRYEDALQRYNILNDPDGPFGYDLRDPEYRDPYLEHEREQYALILPYLKQYAEEEDAANEANAEPTPPVMPRKPEMAVPDAVNGLEPIQKLAALQNLSEAGENVEAARSEAIKDYHNQQMEGMSDEQKLDYMAEQAKKAKENPDSITVDNSVDYDAQLGEEIAKQEEKIKAANDRKTAKRLKDIAKKAPSYKTLRNVNKTLDELNEMEKNGTDVTEAREALQKRAQELSTPETVRQEAVINEAQDEATKIDLQLFAGGNEEPHAFDIVHDHLPGKIAVGAENLLEAMSVRHSTMPTTGFENTIDAINDANNAISDEASFKEAQNDVVDLGAAIKSISSLIDDLMNSRQRLGAEREQLKKDLKEIDDLIAFDTSDQLRLYNNKIKKLVKAVSQMKENEDYKNDPNMAEALQKDIDEATDALEDLEREFGFELSDEQRRKYGDIMNRLEGINRDISRKEAEISDLIAERDEYKHQKNRLTTAIDSSSTAQKIARNAASFRLHEMNGDAKDNKATFIDGRNKAVTMAKNVMKAVRQNGFVAGFKTVFTPEQTAKFLVDGGVVNEKEMDYNHDVATYVSRDLKEQKIMAGLLDLGKSVVDHVQNKIGNEAFQKKLGDLKSTLYGLYYMSGYDETELNKRAKHEIEFDHRIDGFIENVKEQLNEFEADSLYRVLDTQYQLINSNIANAEQLVKDYFSLSTPGELASVLRGDHGGHLPAQVLRFFAGLVMNSTDDENIKKGKTFIPKDIYMNPFKIISEKVLGDGASLFNSVFVAPVTKANGEIARAKQDFAKQLKAVKLDSKADREALAYILDGGITPENVIIAHGKERGEKLNKAAEVHRRIYATLNDMINVTYSRNGLNALKRRNNYYPHVLQEQNALLREMGINSNFDEIATGMLGHTEGTTPSHKFSLHEMERTEDTLTGMDLDAERVMNSYLDYALRSIHMTDNIIRLNDLISALGGRERTGDEKKDYDLSILDYTDSGEVSNRKPYNTFLAAIETYRDQLAGKKSGLIDRSAEKGFARKFYSTISGLQKIQSASKVGLNLAPVVANVIPVMTAAGIHPMQCTKAAVETIASMYSRRHGGIDTLYNASNFLQSRHADREARCTFDKVTNTLMVPMSVTDNITSEIVWRTYYNSFLKQVGPQNAQQAILMADQAAIDTMADKSIGNKGALYNDTVGGMMLQFTQEAFNNLEFLFGGGLKAYSGAYNNKVNMMAGTAKALASLISMMFSGYWMNKLTGRTIALDPGGAIEAALYRRKQGDDLVDVIKSAGSVLLDAANPISNISDNGIFGAPVPSAAKETVESLADAVSGLAKSSLKFMQGDGASFDWAESLVDAAWNWVPGGAAITRVTDTAKTMMQGYGTAKNGNVKFYTEPTVGKTLKAAAFGVNSLKDAEEYRMSGYKSIPESTVTKTSNIKAASPGMSWYQAYQSAKVGDEASASEKDSAFNEKAGGNYMESYREAKAQRTEAGVPGDISPDINKYVKPEKMDEMYKIWQETGKDVYPKSEPFSFKTKDGQKYIESKGKLVSVSDSDIETMKKDYYRSYAAIINANKDPDTIIKRMNNAKTSIIESYFK